MCACIIVQIKDINLHFTPCFNGLVYFITHHTTFVKHIVETLNLVTDSTVCTNYSSIYCMGMDLSNVLRMFLHGLLFVSLSCSRCDLAYDIASDLTAITHTHIHVRTHTSTHQHIQLFCGIFLLKFPLFFNSSTISEVCFLLVSRAALAGLCVLGGCHLDLLFDLASQLTDLPLISPDPWLAGEKAKEKVMT